eukprot:933227-Prymnesium_polylepis.2
MATSLQSCEAGASTPEAGSRSGRRLLQMSYMTCHLEAVGSAMLPRMLSKRRGSKLHCATPTPHGSRWFARSQES